MTESIRYAPSRGALVQPLESHAAAIAGRICEAVRARGTATPEEVVADIVSSVLRASYTAGVREGDSRTTAGLEATVSRLVARAVEGIRFKTAICPHCNMGCTDYGPCEICEGTGKRHEPIRG